MDTHFLVNNQSETFAVINAKGFIEPLVCKVVASQYCLTPDCITLTKGQPDSEHKENTVFIAHVFSEEDDTDFKETITLIPVSYYEE